ncbi:MAG: NUDIX hydrolase [Lachnospiraceae bacterium]|nr:NUDIX hydrolase [Lachnospiraceae bacterium]
MRIDNTESNTHLVWEPVKEEHLINDEWIDFRVSSWRFPNGKIFEPYYSYSRKDYVVIVATDEAGRYICVRQFRQGIREITTEFTAGGIEKGEDPIAAAKRELAEETGYVSDDWELLTKIPSNATMADNHAYIITAGGCRKEKERHLDPMEFIDVELIEAQDLKALIDDGDFKQAVHIAAYYIASDKG